MTPRSAAGTIALMVALGIALLTWYRLLQTDASLTTRLHSIRTLGGERRVACAQLSAAQPLVLLALGQSNAGNHGSAGPTRLPPVTLIADGECVLAEDPLPDATGTGASIWRRLPDALARKGFTSPVVLSVLAVESTSIDDWIDLESPLRKSLETTVATVRRLGRAPAFVLWQQGEADAMAGREAAAYASGLTDLVATLRDAGSDAPVLLARSTLCRAPANLVVRAAVDSAASGNRRMRLGPDIDALQGPEYRYDGCHLSETGLSTAAALWAEKIVALTAHD